MKRGQITIFVIVGIILLLVVILLLTFRFTNKAPELSPEEVAQISGFVESCSDDALERLLRQIGSSGGHLSTIGFRHHPNPWENDVVLMPAQEVVYWSHLKECSQSEIGCESSEQPALCSRQPCAGPVGFGSIQSQLEEALPQEIMACLDDFSLLKESFEIEASDEMEAIVSFDNDAVRVVLDYPLQVARDDASMVLNDFLGEAYVNLPRMYVLAHNISQAQRRYGFIEDRTMHLLSIFSGVGTPLPPLREVTLLGKKQYWSRTEVENIIRYDLLPWLNFMQLGNTVPSFRPIRPQDESYSDENKLLYEGIYYYLIVKAGNETYDDLGVKFTYPYSRPYVSINNGQELLKPRGFGGGFLSKLTGILINDFRFRYDMSFPLVVTVSDPEAMDGDGYSFSFALEGNIRENAAVDRNATADNFVFATNDIDLSSEEQRVDRVVRIRATDAQTNEPLSNVRISYSCGDEAFIGETNSRGVLETQLPYCRFGGALLYSRPGYLGSGEQMDNYEEGGEVRVDVSLDRTVPVRIVLRKAVVQSITNITIENLSSVDVAMVNFLRLGEEYDEEHPVPPFFTLGEAQEFAAVEVSADALTASEALTENFIDEFIAQSAIPANETLAVNEVVLNLAPGEYNIDAFLMRNEEFSIPAEKRGGVIGIGGVTLPQTNLSSWITGGAKINFTITRAELESGRTLVLYVLEQPLPQDWETLEEYVTPEEYQVGKENLIRPIWE